MPIWAYFELFTMGDFGIFYECMDMRVKEDICKSLGLPPSAASSLSNVIWMLKDLRNAIAHDKPVFDLRFQTTGIGKYVRHLVESNFKVRGVSFASMTDYVLLMVLLMKSVGVRKSECHRFLRSYKAVVDAGAKELPANIGIRIVGVDADNKLVAAKRFVTRSWRRA